MGEKTARKDFAECDGSTILAILSCGVAAFIGREASNIRKIDALLPPGARHFS